jgi:molecular chaperone HscB
MAACPHCGAALETPVFCAACKRPLALTDGTDPFAVLGLVPGYAVDPKDLRKRMLRISRDVHPDFFGAAGAELRELAEKGSARVNKAHEILSDDFARADWLVKSLGGPDEQTERAMPREFLMEVLEWNETLEEARANAGTFDPRLGELRTELTARRADSLTRIAALLTPLPERGSANLLAVRQHLNAVRYVDRALSEIEALRLARAAGG